MESWEFRGNFLELFSPLSSVGQDFEKQCRAVHSSAKYASSEIQNELIRIAAMQ